MYHHGHLFSSILSIFVIVKNIFNLDTHNSYTNRERKRESTCTTDAGNVKGVLYTDLCASIDNIYIYIYIYVYYCHNCYTPNYSTVKTSYIHIIDPGVRNRNRTTTTTTNITEPVPLSTCYSNKEKKKKKKGK